METHPTEKRLLSESAVIIGKVPQADKPQVFMVTTLSQAKRDTADVEAEEDSANLMYEIELDFSVSSPYGQHVMRIDHESKYYDYSKDKNALIRILLFELKVYNLTVESKIDLVLFEYTVKHCYAILIILMQPRGMVNTRFKNVLTTLSYQ